MTASGRVASSAKKITLDGLSAKLAGAKVRADATMRLARDRDAAIRFELDVENLTRLRKGLPDMPFSMSGNFAESRDKLELKDVKSRIGATELSGWASMTRNDKRHVEAEVATPRLDLSQFSEKETDSDAKRQRPVRQAPRPRTPNSLRKSRRANTSSAINPWGWAKGIDAKLHFVAGEVKLGAGMLKDVDGTLVVDAGQLAFEGNATGGLGGTLDSALKLKSTSAGTADVELDLAIKDMRAGFAAEGVDLASFRRRASRCTSGRAASRHASWRRPPTARSC